MSGFEAVVSVENPDARKVTEIFSIAILVPHEFSIDAKPLVNLLATPRRRAGKLTPG